MSYAFRADPANALLKTFLQGRLQGLRPSVRRSESFVNARKDMIAALKLGRCIRHALSLYKLGALRDAVTILMDQTRGKDNREQESTCAPGRLLL